MPTAIVTGAFSFTGRFIARELLSRGWTVRTLTNSRYSGDPLAEQVAAFPLDLGDADGLARSMEGADAFFNTYWVRYAHGGATFDTAVANTRVLCDAAGRAGVSGIVQVGVVGAAPDSPHPYLAWKWKADEQLRATGLPHAIVQPTLIYGEGDVLINNICWMLRRIPAFFVPATGRYLVQPVAGEDVASVCVDLAEGELTGQVVDVGGPDRYEYRDFIRLLRNAVGGRGPVLRMPPAVVFGTGTLLGLAIRDMVVTRDEIRALVGGTLSSPAAPIGSRRFEIWLSEHASSVGRRWVRRNTRQALPRDSTPAGT